MTRLELLVVLSIFEVLLAPATIAATNSRAFLMGFTPFPYDFTEDAVRDTRKFIQQNSDLVAQHIEGVPWKEAAEGKAFHPNLTADWKGRKAATPPRGRIYLALSPGRGDLGAYRGAQENMPMPAEFKGKRFDDPLVRNAYLNYCRRSLEFFEPDFLAIGIEANEVEQAGAAKWSAYVNLHRFIYETLKKERPELPIFASFTLHGFLNVQGQAQQDMLSRFEQIMPFNDLIAVSFYPFIAGGTTNIASAFGWLTNQFDRFQKPYAIAETGEAAEHLTFPKSKQEIAGTPEKQAAYYEQLLALAQARHFRFVVSFLPRDYDALWEEIKNASPEAFLAWRDCGMLDEHGTERPAFRIWKSYLDRPYQPN